jgi:hypothetical protein
MYPQWRLWRIVSDLSALWAKHGEDIGAELDNTGLMSLTICTYHIEGANLVEKKEMREAQKECPKNPEPEYFISGYCSRYRPKTGHCDRHDWEAKEDK